MHYVERLKNEIAEKQVKLMLTYGAINSFRLHLNSSKFHNDTTIQVGDVHRRLDGIVNALRGYPEE